VAVSRYAAPTLPRMVAEVGPELTLAHAASPPERWPAPARWSARPLPICRQPAAGTDMHRDVAWRVTGGVDGGHARRHLRPGLDQMHNQPLPERPNYAGEHVIFPRAFLVSHDEFFIFHREAWWHCLLITSTNLEIGIAADTRENTPSEGMTDLRIHPMKRSSIGIT
jgi:hypothetical protein